MSFIHFEICKCVASSKYYSSSKTFNFFFLASKLFLINIYLQASFIVSSVEIYKVPSYALDFINDIHSHMMPENLSSESNFCLQFYCCI